MQAFSGLARTSDRIDTGQLAHSLTTLADLTRDTPKNFRHALAGVSALSTNLAARDQQIGTLLQNLRCVSHTLDARDQDIVGLMRDSSVLFQALDRRRQAIHRLLRSTSQLSVELTRLVTPEPRRPEARPDPSQQRGRRARTRTPTTSTRACG